MVQPQAVFSPTEAPFPAMRRRGAASLRRTGRWMRIVAALLPVLLASGCATPTIQPADPKTILLSDSMFFLQDGVTTREQVALKLGLPSAQLEGERILMYQLTADKEGKWRLAAPRWDAGTGMRSWSEGTYSLVLVFGEDGVLRQHSLVTAQ